MYNKAQGRNNHGRFIQVNNPPKNQPQFKVKQVTITDWIMKYYKRGVLRNIPLTCKAQRDYSKIGD